MAGAPPGADRPPPQLQRVADAELVQEYTAGAPVRGLMEGLDPALLDGQGPGQYSSLFSPDIENFRVVQGKWETRLGQSLWQTLPGSGNVRLLDTLYQSSGTIIRLVVRGSGAAGQLYKLTEGTDLTFQSVAGGGSLGGSTTNLFQGVVEGDRYYFTDRAGAFRYYDPAGSPLVKSVTQPAAPVAPPRVRARWFDRLDTFSGASPYGWTQSSAADFGFAALNTTDPQTPGGGNTVNIKVITASGVGNTITKDVSSQTLNSHSIAFWINEHFNSHQVDFEIGIGQANEYSVGLQAAMADNWYPVFLPVGDLPSINFKRFRCVATPNAPGSMWVSSLYLPGNLEGWYRWCYTHYDPALGRESAPSAISNGNQASDFSAIGRTNDVTTQRAFQKCALLDFTSDSGVDSSTTKIRIYRNGGVPSLTRDSTDRDVWFRVGEIFDQSTTLNGAVTAGGTSIVVNSATNIAVGDTLVLDKGSIGTEEYVTVTAIVGATLTVKGADANAALLRNHANGASVQIAFIDNTPNELVDVTLPIDRERNDPPAGAQFVARSPEGRFWFFNYSGKPTGVAVSNRATPDRPRDYEVCPDGVDPLTRRSRTQGFRFQIGGDVTDEAIVWGGLYQGLMHVLTKRHMYVIMAHSQADWGPTAIQKVLNIGCIAGDTVREVNGELTWVADGPRVVRWAGRGQAPQVISHLRVNVRLDAAPKQYWGQWLAVYHVKKSGNYYCLYLTPSGQTTNSQRLDYNADADAWEPLVYYDASGNPLAWQAAHVREGGTDQRDLYQASSAGLVYQTEIGNLDGSVPIKVRGKTKKIPLSIHSRFPSGALGDVAPGSTRHLLIGMVTVVTQAFLRFAPVSDSLTLTVLTGGAEYGDQTHTYTIPLSGAGTGNPTGTDVEFKQRLHRDLYGRWCQLTFSGDVSNRPAIREVVFFGLPLRAGAIQS